MGYCTSCGSPSETNSCSMCYGDIAYGSDGYYEEWALEEQRIEQERDYMMSLPEIKIEQSSIDGRIFISAHGMQVEVQITPDSIITQTVKGNEVLAETYVDVE